MQKIALLILPVISGTIVLAQPEAGYIDKIIVPVVSEQKKAPPFATVELTILKGYQR